jgi:hypothetical protein
MAAQQLLERLRKLNAQCTINWVEALPLVLNRLHDTPGETGLSPYQILFGRERSNGNLPYDTPKDCEDAQTFFHRMEIVDEEVARILNEKHEQQARTINVSRSEPRRFVPGDKVWWLRPPNTGGKLDTRWLGPCKVVRRVGEHSYLVQTAPNYRTAIHATYLKPFVGDIMLGTRTELFLHRKARVEPRIVSESAERTD